MRMRIRAPPNFAETNMPVGKRKRLDICRECKSANRPAITAARLGHTGCLATAYRELGVFNERDDFGATPIHFAARNGHLECLKWLVTRSGVSPNAVARNGATAAHDAAAMGYLGCLHYLLENTACSAKDTTVEGATALHMACRFGRLKVVKWLMDYTGASPGEKGANDVTPVHLCAAKNHLECLQWLTRHHLYVPNEKTVHGATAVYFGAQEGSIDCLSWLVEQGSGDPHMMAEDGMSPIHAAAQAGHIPCLTFLKSIGVSVRTPAEDGATPAHFAAASGQVETLEWILDNGGSALDKDNLGGTPVHDAAEQGQVSTLTALIQRGVPTHQEDYEGLKPLDLAKDNEHNECTQLLFKTISPSLLTSITPRHSMTRASAAENQQRRAELAEKQREFESTLMTGVSEERREAIWSRAQQQAAAGPQPGLNMLLDGEVGASSSQFSLDRGDPLTRPAPAPPTSTSRSRHSTSRRAPSSVKTIDDDMDMMPYKPRPVLSPALFEGPPPLSRDNASAADHRPNTKKVKTEVDKPLEVNGMEQKSVRTEQRLAVTKATNHKASPIPKRAKFLRKFSKKGVKKSKQQFAPVGSPSKTESGAEEKMEAEGRGEVRKGEEEEERGGEEGEWRVDVTAPDKELPLDTQQPINEMKLAAMHAGSYTGGGWEGGRLGSECESGPYDMISENLVQGALKESLAAARGETQLPPIKPSPPSPPSPPPPTLPTISVHQPSEKREPMKEKAVITKQKARKSLKTPDETVTVNFIPQQSNVKKSFPVTHARLLKDEDLSSPGESEEDEDASTAAVAQVDSSGFEKLDLLGFEEFGERRNDTEIQGKAKEEKAMEDGEEKGTDVEEEEEEGGAGEQSSNNMEVVVAEKKGESEKEGETEKEVKGKEEVTHFKEVDTSMPDVLNKKQVERAASMDTVKPPELPLLKKWGDIQNLEQSEEIAEGEMDPSKSVPEEEEEREPGESGRKLSVVPEENEDEAETPLKSLPHNVAHTEGVRTKQPEKEEEPETEVLKRVTKMEVSAAGKGAGVGGGGRGKGLEKVKVGSVSEKLKMFGGGRKVTRSVSDSATKNTITSKTGRATTNGKSAESEIFKDEISPLPNIDKQGIRRNSEEKLRMDGLPSLSPPLQRASKTPSPPASPPLGRLQEEEEEEEESNDGTARVTPTPSSAQLRRKSSTGVFSPLMISTDASSNRSKSENLEKKVETLSQLVTPPTSKTLEMAIRDEKRWSLRDERARRQLYALSAEGKVGSRESAYMGWASSPQLAQMKQRWEKEAGESAKKRVAGLLRTPQLTGPQVPLEFRGLQPREPGRLSLWRQKTGSLQKILSPESINFEETNIFIFLKEPLHGPILHHVYLWLGGRASDLSVSSAHQHCQQLMHCLPGGSPLHKEVQGHESGGFMSAIGVGVASKLAGSTPYVNTSLETATLYNLNETFMTFQAMLTRPPSHSDLMTSPTPSVLDTHNRVCVWLPAGYWGNQTNRSSSSYQKSVLDIGQAFLLQKGYPKWAPVTVLTQHCETLQFISHFTAWPNMNFDLAPPTFRPILKNLHLLELTTPTIKTNPSDMKIYRVEGNERRPLPPVPSSHLSAGGVYMFQWTTCHASPLYTWVETSLCVWVGSRVADYWAAVENCIKHTEKEMPLTLVASGQEPPQLLSFFKGTLVVHSSPHSSPHPSPLLSTPHRFTPSPGHTPTRLYQVSGTSLERIKAIEVPPTSSSLCSTHCYILSAPPLLYSWSGHLSSEETRTGALYMAQILSSSQKPLLVAEGQEDEEFWKCLGGKNTYQHYDHQKFPNWSVPMLYCGISSSQDSLTFTQLPPAKKKDLKSNGCYILWFRNQLFVWMGVHWKSGSFTAVLKAYLSQCHSGRTARDFLVTVAHEGQEGEGFWQWFELQRCLEPKTTESLQDLSVKKPLKEDEKPNEATPTVATPTKYETTPTRDEATPTVSGEEGGSSEKGKEEVEEEEKEEDSSTKLPPPSPLPTSTTETSPSTAESETREVEETPTACEEQAIVEAEERETTDEGAVTAGAIAEEGGAAELGHVTQPTNQIPEDEGMENLSASSLLTQPGDLVASKQKKRTKKASIKTTNTVTVHVEVEGGRVVTVTLREGAPVISAMFQVAKAAGMTLAPTSSLFEISPQLRLQRLLEDHEVVKSVSSQWPTGKHRPKLFLTSFHSKNMLWETNPPIPQSSITAYLRSGTFPDLTNELFYSPRATKLQWKKATFKLSTDGIYITSGSGVSQLYASLEHHLYTPTPSATLSTPTRFCFALRPNSSWKLKDIKLFCSSDLHTMAKWVHGMRLLQHGRQLKVNLQAMRLRVLKREI